MILPTGTSRTVALGAVVLVIVVAASLLIFDFSIALGSSDDLPIVRIGRSDQSEEGPEEVVSRIQVSVAVPGSPRPTPTTVVPTVSTSIPAYSEEEESRVSDTDVTTRTFVPEEVWIRNDDRDDRHDDHQDDRGEGFHHRTSRRDR